MKRNAHGQNLREKDFKQCKGDVADCLCKHDRLIFDL